MFNACLNLVGHKGAGKTSLATRLMGRDFNPDLESTKGISIHFVQSRFKKNEQKIEKWEETSLDSSSYMTDFSHAVLARLKSTKLRRRRRRSTPNLMVAAASAKNSSTTESNHDLKQLGDKTLQQAIKPPEKCSEMSNAEVNCDKRIDVNNTQDQKKQALRKIKQRGKKEASK